MLKKCLIEFIRRYPNLSLVTLLYTVRATHKSTEYHEKKNNLKVKIDSDFVCVVFLRKYWIRFVNNVKILI